MANGFTDDQLSAAICGALGVSPVGSTFLPDAIYFYESNPEDNPGYDSGPFPLGIEPNFTTQKGYLDVSMNPGIPGTYQNSYEMRWTNNEVSSVTITHMVISFNANSSWFTLQLETPVTVAAGGTFKRYPGTIIMKVTR